MMSHSLVKANGALMHSADRGVIKCVGAIAVTVAVAVPRYQSAENMPRSCSLECVHTIPVKISHCLKEFYEAGTEVTHFAESRSSEMSLASPTQRRHGIPTNHTTVQHH